MTEVCKPRIEADPVLASLGGAGWQEVCGPEECRQAGGTRGNHVGGQPFQDLGPLWGSV